MKRRGCCSRGAGSSCHRDSICERQLGLHLQSWPPLLPFSPFRDLCEEPDSAALPGSNPCPALGEHRVGAGGKRWMPESIMPDGWMDGVCLGEHGLERGGGKRGQTAPKKPYPLMKAKVWAVETQWSELHGPLLAPQGGRASPDPAQAGKTQSHPKSRGRGAGSTFCPR